MEQQGVQKDIQTRIFEWFARRYSKIVPLFKYLYVAQILFLLFGAYTVFTNHPIYSSNIYFLAVNCGRTALILLGIVVLPGILGRFGVEIKLTRIITLFRRQLGIYVFLLALTHYQLVRFLPRQAGIFPNMPPFPVFETIGFFAFSLLFLMFLTSNNFSQKKLGRWWKRLHRVVYVVLWLLVLHTGLQRISIFSIFIFVMASLELASLVYTYFKRKALASNSAKIAP